MSHVAKATLLMVCVFSITAMAAPVGQFEDHQDIGTLLHPGSSQFDSDLKTYTLSASGENMWAAKDAFQFLFSQAKGDLSLSADISFLGAGTDKHRKACLMIRQTLDADSAYIDVALHGDGLTSLQFREAKGALTHEVQSNLINPKRVRLEKRGQFIYLYLSTDSSKDEDLKFCGASHRLTFSDPFYVGLAVCSHNKDITESANFSSVQLTSDLPAATAKPTLYSTLETQSVTSTDRRVTYTVNARIEAPNWLKDGTNLIYNQAGRIYRIPAAGGQPQVIDTGFATRCNNDHAPSPDGSLLAISDQSQGNRQSLIYILPITGGAPKLITPTGPSYFHGWSSDGKTLAYCAQRNGEFDIYTIPATAGENPSTETRLTSAKGLDDGPEYSPDGKFIYFNSERTGQMQIWRMNADGSNQEQVTTDEFNNWFPHPSPDGKKLLFLSYGADVKGHPENQLVTLRVLTFSTNKIDTLANVFGGQGTINTPCWSGDSKKIAFISYHLIP
jgi:TolB protein